MLVSFGCNRAPSSGKPRVAVVLKALDSEFWLAVKRGAEEGAAGKAELGIVAPDREINIDQQVSMIEDQVSRGVAAIVLAPGASAQVIPPLEKAAAKGIPVIIVDTDVDWPKKITYVGTNNYEGGRLAGQYLVTEISGKAQVALITGLPGEETHEQRKRGFKDVVLAETRLQLVAEQPANSERALGMNVMENILTARPDVEAVFATSDQMALGALEAIRTRRSGKPIKLVSFDAGSEVLRLIREGKVDAVVAQRPFQMGKRGVEAALQAIAGQKVDPVIDTGTLLVTRENVESFKAE
ncbi:MAG: sugar ABC transporter substrate-binding protein [Acidobacteria bacterium]|nr:sugar ABC transporter substrate-binding protein [Acidobacteriota bacterium]